MHYLTYICKQNLNHTITITITITMNHLCGLFLCSILLFTSCSTFQKQNYNPQKVGANDPFKTTMVASEFFEFDAKTDKVVEGEKGTVISFPKGCFLDDKGNTINDKVKVELAEALTLDDMLLSGLTTTSNGKMLETGGMIYLNPTTLAGANVFINPKIPVMITIPAANKRAGMMAYSGYRAEDGKIDWTNPKPIESYLEHVDIAQLDFLPPDFAREVKKGLPFAGYTVATKELTDSLYYSLAAYFRGVISVPAPKAEIEQIEPHYNPNKEVKDGKYTDESYVVHGHQEREHTSSDLPPDEPAATGIDPAVIKTLRSDKFNNTFIATREFEKRLNTIFKSCHGSVLMLYIQNTNKNLWEVDEMAAAQLGENSVWGKKFKAFARLKQTNVRNAGNNAALINNYFAEQLATVSTEILALEDKANKLKEAHSKIVDSVATAYRKLLWEREKYRMERYKFQWTNTGWVNVDTGTDEKNWSEKKLEVTVTRGKEFDRVETYIVYESIKSIYHLATLDKEVHFVGQDPKRSMVMPKLQPSKIVAMGYKGDKVYMGVVNYITGSTDKARVALQPSNKEAVKRALLEIEKGTFNGNVSAEADTGKESAFNVSKASGYNEANSIAVDLDYQDFFFKEEKYQHELQLMLFFQAKLIERAFPCKCVAETDIEYGHALYVEHCAACHAIFADGIGPPLAGLTSKRTMPWLASFTRNWHG